MRKLVILFIGFLALVLLGCAGQEEEDKQVKQEDIKEEEEVEEGESDPSSDLGDLEAWIGGEVLVEEDKVTVKGESNLLPGSFIESGAQSGDWAVVGYQKGAEVQEDGSFEFEFDSSGSATVRLSLSSTRDVVADHYGDNLENVTGSQVYTTETSGEYQVKAEYTYDPDEEKPYTIPIEVPEWDIPSDYGDEEVWMEADVTSDHNTLYFDVKSNLLEGSYVGGNFKRSSGQIEPFSFDHTYVNPDGSFKLSVKYQNLREGMYMPVWFEPDSDSWEDVVNLYGEKGEHLEGDLVHTNDDDEQYALYKIMIDVPDLNPSDEVDVTMEDEEVKMQVPDDLLFDFDESKLKKGAKEELDQIITDLKKLEEGTEIEINGHTDDAGEKDYNLVLSQERADAVFDYLQEVMDLSDFDVQTKGYGYEQPIMSLEDEDKVDDKRSRRVEIVIRQ